MKSLIVARKKEQLILNQLLQEPTAQFLAVYGRPQPLRDEVIMVVKQKTPTPCNKKKNRKLSEKEQRRLSVFEETCEVLIYDHPTQAGSVIFEK